MGFVGRAPVLVVVLVALAVAGSAQAAGAARTLDCIAVIGTGSVGGTLGPRWGRAGRSIVYGSRTPDTERVRELVAASGANARATTPALAAGSCALVLFAVPWEAAESSFRSLGSLDGKLIMDVSNPLDVRDGEVVALPVPDSGAEQLQRWAAGAVVVKAFNTVNWRVMADPAIVAGPVSVPLSGDDDDAKARVADLVRLVGLEPLDVGPLRTARHTEHMALLYVGMLLRGTPREFHLQPRRP